MPCIELSFRREGLQYNSLLNIITCYIWRITMSEIEKTAQDFWEMDHAFRWTCVRSCSWKHNSMNRDTHEDELLVMNLSTICFVYMIRTIRRVNNAYSFIGAQQYYLQYIVILNKGRDNTTTPTACMLSHTHFFLSRLTIIIFCILAIWWSFIHTRTQLLSASTIYTHFFDAPVQKKWEGYVRVPGWCKGQASSCCIVLIHVFQRRTWAHQGEEIFHLINWRPKSVSDLFDIFLSGNWSLTLIALQLLTERTTFWYRNAKSNIFVNNFSNIEESLDWSCCFIYR